jgi:hypothetical protein
MSKLNYSKFRGIAAIICGFLTAIFWFLHPASADPTAPHDSEFWDAIQSGRYSGVNALFILILLFNLFALTGFYAQNREKGGYLAFFGFLLAFIGTSLFVGAGIFQAFVAPVLAKAENTRSLLEQSGPLLNGPLGAIFASTGMIFALGYILMAVSMLRTKVFTTLGAVLLFSAPILGLSPLMPLPVRIVGCLAYGAAHIILGRQLIKPAI